MNESTIFNFFKSRFSPSAIFEARKSSKKNIILQTALLCILLMLPISIGIYRFNFEAIVFGMESWILDADDMQSKVINLKDGEYAVFNDLVIARNYNPILDTYSKYILMTDDYVRLNYNGLDLYGEYFHNLAELQLENNVAFIAALLTGIQYQILSMLVLMAYPIIAILNVVFIACIAYAASSMNFKAEIPLNFREFFALIAYASTLPVLLSVIIGAFVSVTFVYIIYNFGVAGFTHYVYKKAQRRSKYEHSEL